MWDETVARKAMGYPIDHMITDSDWFSLFFFPILIMGMKLPSKHFSSGDKIWRLCHWMGGAREAVCPPPPLRWAMIIQLNCYFSKSTHTTNKRLAKHQTDILLDFLFQMSTICSSSSSDRDSGDSMTIFMR